MNHSLAFGLALALLIILVSGVAFAGTLTISAPEQVNITDKTSFFVDITSNSAQSEDLKVSFFAPTKVEVSAPTIMGPNSTAKAKITVYGSKEAKEISSKLEVMLGNSVQQKEVTLSYAANPNISENFVGALFGFGSFVQEATNFSIMEWGVFWVLVIIAAVLLIAFVARVARRA